MRRPKLLTSVIIFSFLTVKSFGLSPVIFIPGDGGSQLEAKLNKTNVVHYICAKTSNDYFNIWLNLELLVPFVIDCWVDNLRLDYDNVTRTTKNPPGVDIKIPGWGNPEPVEWLDPSHDSAGAYFNTIGDALVKIGYVRNVSLRGAPYDFRKAPNENEEFFVKLKTLVEETYTINNKTPVTLFTHSMGGSMALHFLRLQAQGWKDQYIRRMISLSTPWGGAMKALKVFAIGDDLGSLMLRESIMRTEQITCPSLAWLLPSPNFWKASEVLVQTDKFNYTINDFQKLFTDMDVPNAWEMRKDTEKYSRDFSAPGVELHCLYGYNISTVESEKFTQTQGNLQTLATHVQFVDSIDPIAVAILVYKPGTWLDGYPTLVTGDGDGTVNLRSLNACEHWAKRRNNNRTTHNNRSTLNNRTTLNNNKPIKSLPLKQAEHLKILHDPRVLEYVTTVLGNP